MPYLFFIVIISIVLSLYAKNTAVDEAMDISRSMDTTESFSLAQTMRSIKLAIEVRQADFFAANWECSTNDEPCTGVYDRIPTDDGYVSDNTWKEALIPTYLSNITLPDNWTISLRENYDELRVCIQMPATEDTKTLIKGLFGHEKNIPFAVSDGCDSGTVVPL